MNVSPEQELRLLRRQVSNVKRAFEEDGALALANAPEPLQGLVDAATAHGRRRQAHWRATAEEAAYRGAEEILRLRRLLEGPVEAAGRALTEALARAAAQEGVLLRAGREAPGPRPKGCDCANPPPFPGAEGGWGVSIRCPVHGDGEPEDEEEPVEAGARPPGLREELLLAAGGEHVPVRIRGLLRRVAAELPAPRRAESRCYACGDPGAVHVPEVNAWLHPGCAEAYCASRRA